MPSPRTQYWTVDAGEYKAKYALAMNQLKAFPDTLVKQLSTPEAYALSDDYAKAKPRILVYGQETYGNFQAAAGCSPYEAWSRQIGGSIAFDYAYGGDPHQAGGKFWRAFDEIAAAFGLPSRRALAWSNLVKVQLLEASAASFSINKLKPEERMTVVKWQRDLFHAELCFICPDAVLFLTGGLHWVAGHMFAGYCDNQRDGFSIVTVHGLNIPMAKTYHPNARVPNVQSGRNGAVAYLRFELGL